MVGGGDQDYAKAANWYGKGAETGDGPSQYALASLYENGHGVPQDYVQAYKWYVLAMTSGQLLITGDGKIIRSGAEDLARLESKMTPAQIDEAKQLIAEARSLFPDRGPPAIPGPLG